MTLSYKINKILSIPSVEVISIHVHCKGLSSSMILEELQAAARTCQENNHKWLQHPLGPEEIARITTCTKAYYVEPCKHLNTLFHDADLLSKIYYLNLIGVTVAIDRHKSFRDVVGYQKFCNALTARSITNPPWIIDAHGLFEHTIKRIHLLQPDFLDDPEISQGLHVSHSKNTPIDRVLYVCSEALLTLAIQHCTPGVTLIVDGHWEHKKHCPHGVWEDADAYMIAQSLQHLTHEYPDKISSIRLWGCSSGQIAIFDELSEHFNPHNLLFKNQSAFYCHDQEMAAYRNRAVYYSTHEETPYDTSSLAGHIIRHTPSSIRITAVPSYGYPFPFDDTPRFNIGSDAPQWHGTHYWTTPNDTYPTWYQQLHTLKSITVIREKSPPKQWPLKKEQQPTHTIESYGFFSSADSKLSTSATPLGELDLGDTAIISSLSSP